MPDVHRGGEAELPGQTGVFLTLPLRPVVPTERERSGHDDAVNLCLCLNLARIGNRLLEQVIQSTTRTMAKGKHAS